MNFSMSNVVAHMDTLGRPLMRLLGVLVLFVIMLSVAAAFVSWGFFHTPMPELPGQGILVAGLGYGYQAWDNWVRSGEKKNEMNARTASPVNEHGGPTAP